MSYSPYEISCESLYPQQIRDPCCITRRQHFTLHLPLLLNALPGKVERSFSVFRVQVIKHLHQPFTSGPRSVLVEQVKLSHTLAEEVTQHYSGFLVPMPILPDFVQALYRGVDNVATILRWREQLH